MWRFKARRDGIRAEKFAQALSESTKKAPNCTWLKVAD